MKQLTLASTGFGGDRLRQLLGLASCKFTKSGAKSVPFFWTNPSRCQSIKMKTGGKEWINELLITPPAGDIIGKKGPGY